jgi:hypothetical protein
MKAIKYIFLGCVLLGYFKSLNPFYKTKIKATRSVEINIVPNYNNHGLNKADSG